MKQGSEYVYVKMSLDLFKAMKGEWSAPVCLKLDEGYDGDIELITRNVKNMTLHDLAEILNG